MNQTSVSDADTSSLPRRTTAPVCNSNISYRISKQIHLVVNVSYCKLIKTQPIILTLLMFRSLYQRLSSSEEAASSSDEGL